MIAGGFAAPVAVSTGGALTRSRVSGEATVAGDATVGETVGVAAFTAFTAFTGGAARGGMRRRASASGGGVSRTTIGGSAEVLVSVHRRMRCIATNADANNASVMPTATTMLGPA
jgi:hypothetical protein